MIDNKRNKQEGGKEEECCHSRSSLFFSFRFHRAGREPGKSGDRENEFAHFSGSSHFLCRYSMVELCKQNN